jgi:hypothetical protein
MIANDLSGTQILKLLLFLDMQIRQEDVNLISHALKSSVSQYTPVHPWTNVSRHQFSPNVSEKLGHGIYYI